MQYSKRVLIGKATDGELVSIDIELKEKTQALKKAVRLHIKGMHYASKQDVCKAHKHQIKLEQLIEANKGTSLFTFEHIAELAAQSVANPIMAISPGNPKTGNIPSFSLPPVQSCPEHDSCANFTDDNGKQRKCYALKAYTQYLDTELAWNRNFKLVQTALPELERQLKQWFAKNKPALFRIHVSGDFCSKPYFAMWLRVARNNPDTLFLAYTKALRNIRGHILPANFSLIISTMPSTNHKGQAIQDKHELPLAMVSSETIQTQRYKTIACPEQVTEGKVACAECQLCWKLPQLRTRINIQFLPH